MKVRKNNLLLLSVTTLGVIIISTFFIRRDVLTPAHYNQTNLDSKSKSSNQRIVNENGVFTNNEYGFRVSYPEELFQPGAFGPAIYPEKALEGGGLSAPLYLSLSVTASNSEGYIGVREFVIHLLSLDDGEQSSQYEEWQKLREYETEEYQRVTAMARPALDSLKGNPSITTYWFKQESGIIIRASLFTSSPSDADELIPYKELQKNIVESIEFF